MENKTYAELLAEAEAAQEQPAAREKPAEYYSNSDPSDDVQALVQEIVTRSIDIAPEYDDWVSLGFALESEFGKSGRELFRTISLRFRMPCRLRSRLACSQEWPRNSALKPGRYDARSTGPSTKEGSRNWLAGLSKGCRSVVHLEFSARGFGSVRSLSLFTFLLFPTVFYANLVIFVLYCADTVHST